MDNGEINIQQETIEESSRSVVNLINSRRDPNQNHTLYGSKQGGGEFGSRVGRKQSVEL